MITAVLAFFGSPLGRWLLIAGMVVAAAVAFGAHERSIGYREAMDHVHAQRQAEERAYLEILAKRQAAFAKLTAEQAVLTEKHEEELKAKDRKRLADLEDLKGRIPTYVSTLSTRACPDLPMGYVLHRRNAADLANGRDASAPEPSPELAAATTGISLSAIADTDAGQAGAFRACTQRVKAWEEYADQVEAWSRAVNLILTGTSP